VAAAARGKAKLRVVVVVVVLVVLEEVVVVLDVVVHMLEEGSRWLFHSVGQVCSLTVASAPADGVAAGSCADSLILPSGCGNDVVVEVVVVADVVVDVVVDVVHDDVDVHQVGRINSLAVASPLDGTGTKGVPRTSIGPRGGNGLRNGALTGGVGVPVASDDVDDVKRSFGVGIGFDPMATVPAVTGTVGTESISSGTIICRTMIQVLASHQISRFVSISRGQNRGFPSEAGQ